MGRIGVTLGVVILLAAAGGLCGDVPAGDLESVKGSLNYTVNEISGERFFCPMMSLKSLVNFLEFYKSISK